MEINHPGFQPLRRPLTRGEFGIERGREPVAKVVLDRGLTVTGRVTDEAGKPIVGARVRTKFLNDIREATTGSDGVYRLAGCEPRTARIVVSAKGRATDMKELRIDSEMGPVDFKLKPGGTVRIRVLDQKGNPVPKARIFFQAVARPLRLLRVRPREPIRRQEWSLGVERSTAGRIQSGYLPPRRDGRCRNNH